MRLIILIILNMVGSLLALTSGAAATTSAFRIGDWEGHAYRNDHTRKFEYCAAQTTNANGITIIYSLNRHYVWSFELSNPSWRFVRGASFQIAFRLNKNETIGRRAYALSSNLVRVSFPNSLEAFTKLSRVLQMDVIFGGLASRFNLAYGPNVLVALTRCVTKYDSSSRRQGLGATSKAKSNSPMDLTASGKVTALATRIIKLTGVKGARLARRDEIPPDLTADVFWKVGPLLFGATTLAADQAPDFNNLPGRIISRDSQLCRRGDFFAGATFQRSDLFKSKNAPRIARIYTFCQIPGTRTSTFYIVTPRKQPGAYVLATIGRGSEFSPAIERVAENFDDGVLSVLEAALK